MLSRSVAFRDEISLEFIWNWFDLGSACLKQQTYNMLNLLFFGGALFHPKSTSLAFLGSYTYNRRWKRYCKYWLMDSASKAGIYFSCSQIKVTYMCNEEWVMCKSALMTTILDIWQIEFDSPLVQLSFILTPPLTHKYNHAHIAQLFELDGS